MLEEKKLLPPPWLAYPEIERYSIGWRMGYGESYIIKWGDWYNNLPEKEAEEYQKLFPEPVTWRGYWDEDVEEEEDEYYEKGDFWIDFWQKGGKPKYSLVQIQKEYSKGKKMDFIMFWGAHASSEKRITKGCLSQWWKADFWSANHTYGCMEQFMMAKKAELFQDKEVLQQILDCKDPRKIKALGRKVKNFKESIWDKVKYSVVLNGNYMKFSQNPVLKQFLLSTGDCILVEASPYDGIWGIQMSESEENVKNPKEWRGKNLLGFALMEVRDELKRVCQNENLCDKEILTINSKDSLFS